MRLRRMVWLQPAWIAGVLGFISIISILVFSLSESGDRRNANYESNAYDKIHLNIKQNKFILVTTNNKMGSFVGDLMSLGPGLMYWGTPFQVCWESPVRCRLHLETQHTRDLLRLLLNCQLRILAVLKDEVYTSETLENLVERCSKPRNQIIRVSTLKLADIAVLQMEDPFWKLRCVYLLKDPRARLAEIKRSAQFVDTAGTLRQYTNKTYKEVVHQICSRLADDVQHTADNPSPSLLGNLQAYVVREEDLFSDLEQEIRGILSYMDITWTKSIENAVKKIEFPGGKLETKLELNFDSELRALDNWKIQLHKDEILAVERNVKCSRVLRQAGYDMHDFK